MINVHCSSSEHLTKKKINREKIDRTRSDTYPLDHFELFKGKQITVEKNKRLSDWRQPLSWITLLFLRDPRDTERRSVHSSAESVKGTEFW